MRSFSSASDALSAAGVNLLWGPSRHTAGHNVASYHHDPDKVMIEFYTEMDMLIPEETTNELGQARSRSA